MKPADLDLHCSEKSEVLHTGLSVFIGLNIEKKIPLFGRGLLTLCLLVPSADNLCKQVCPRSGPINIDSKLFDTLMVTLEEYSEKVDFEKNHQTTKSMQNYPVGRVNFYDWINCAMCNLKDTVIDLTWSTVIFPHRSRGLSLHKPET